MFEITDIPYDQRDFKSILFQPIFSKFKYDKNTHIWNFLPNVCKTSTTMTISSYHYN